ncbi:MAG: dephospho-CoA kinase [Bacteroidia bacterium]
MKTVGITGGIGSGKSIVCRFFTLLGVPVYDADSAARRLMDADPNVKENVTALFGNKAYLSDGTLNRKEIAARVFSDPAQLEKLNGVVHPAVARDFHQWKQQQPPKQPYVLREAAILFESGSWKDCDNIILVDAPEEIRIQRVMQRDHRSTAEIRNIISRQWTSEKKRNQSDYVIENNEHHLVIPQILAIHRSLTTPQQ